MKTPKTWLLTALLFVPGSIAFAQTFTKITSGAIVNDVGSSSGCAWGDYDNDGDLDLFVANAGGENNFLYRNDGAAGFFKITTGAIVNSGGNSFGASWGDYDNDGDLDLFVSNDGGNNFLYENNGNGSFTRINTGAIVEDGSRSFGSSWGDYDNDGDLDLFVAKLGDDALYRNNGGDSFTKVTAGEIVQAGRLTYGAIWGDYDNDGDLDLFAANILGEDNFLYQNVGTRNHWLNIQLNGTVSNAAAIGAKVSILATIDRSLVRQARELSGQTGYLSQNSLNAEFGLGDAAMADSLRVDWPSGAVNRYANIVADQFLRLQENNRPRIANAIADVTLSSAAPDFVRDLNAAPVVFVDPESDALTYSAASSDTSIVKARLSLSTLTMNLVSETALGQAKITVTADDGKVDDGRGNTEVMTIAVNRRPFVVNQIPNQTIVLRDTSDRLVVADLRNVFLDPDGDAPAYTASSSNGAVAIAIITGSTLSISPRDSSGETTIRVTADDRRGGTAALEFTVKNVLVNTSPRLAGNPIPDQVLIVSGRRFARELNPVFIDDENNDLTYSASSSNLAAAIASISFDTLIVIPRDIGIAVITVRANDGLGGEASTTFKVEVLRSFRPVIFHAPITSRNTDQAVAIEADITDDEGALANATLSYRIAGNANFETIQMERSAINDTTFHVIASIPAIAVTNRGVEYFIAAADTHAVPSRLPASGIFSIRVRVEGQGVRKAGAQPAADEQTGYRLISIPLDLDAKQPGAVLEDDLGAYDPAQWRLFQWVPLATGGVAKVEFPNTSAISPGAALWLIVKSADQFIDSGPGTTVSTAEKFPIPLNRGWNLVGNPFNFPTVAEDTLSDGDPLHIFSYNGVWSGRLDASATQLQPFEGYAVFSSSTAAMLVKPNPFDPESSSPYLIIMNVRSDAFRRSIFVKSLTPEGATTNVHFRSNLRKQTASFNEEASWSIRILAQCQKAKDENNVAAVARDAAREYDRLDHPEPPGIGEYVSVYFPHPEWQRLSKSYCTDFRPEPPEGDEWEFEIKTNIRDVVNLTFAGVESVPLAYDVCLVDKALKITSNLRQRDNYAVAGSGENHPKRLTLVVGKSSYLNEKLAEFRLVPTTYELSQNFPNPFNPATTIRYALPNPERVTLRVYDMLGKVVVTLVDHELKEAGYHAAVWNGRNTAGNLAASSIYFVRMQVGNFVQVRKMVLIE